LLLCYLSALEPSLKALSLKALSLKSLSLKALSHKALNLKSLSQPLDLLLRLNTPTKSMGGTIRAPPVSDLTIDPRA
jgi:hypothetical protein